MPIQCPNIHRSGRQLLNDIDYFIATLVAHPGAFDSGTLLRFGFGRAFEAGDIYCPGCGASRRIRITPMSGLRGRAGGESLNLVDSSSDAIAAQLAPAVFIATCLQDDTGFTFVIFRGPDGYELASLPMKRGGLSTPHTPPGVAYYLDQAQRSQSVGANSAAVSMYRAALEHVLFQQGYKVRMLGPKIDALKKAIEEGTAPRWALDLDETYLSVIGKLGNAAIHPGDGDVEAQRVLDRKLLVELEITFTELLHVVYEREDQQKSRLAALQAAAASFES